MIIFLIILLAARGIEAKKVYLLALVVGIFSDLFSGRLLGTTAMFWLLAAGSVNLYKVRFKMNLVGFLIILSIWEVIGRLF